MVFELFGFVAAYRDVAEANTVTPSSTIYKVSNDSKWHNQVTSARYVLVPIRATTVGL